jgi:hypothetical protein
MHTKSLYVCRFAIALTALANAQEQPQSQEPLWKRILQMSDADQVAYVNQRLNEGLRPVPDDAVGPLISSRSSLVLPVIEKKIEEVLKSPNPRECFTDQTVDPTTFVNVAAWSVAQAGDEHALAAVSKLIALDEDRFGILVRNTLYHAQNRRNPFIVAYRGFEIGSPAVDRRILSWAEEQFGNKTEFRQGQLKQWWAEAMVEEYHHQPTETDWHFDPIASRIQRQLADPFHDDVIRLAGEAYEKRSKEK